MRFKNLAPEVLISAVLVGVLAPLSFIGLDFTDTGYHFINQLHGFDIPRVWKNTAYYPLSDVLVHAGLLMTGATSLMAYRLCGAMIWAVNGALALRYFRLTLGGAGDGAGVIGPSVLVPALLLSVKPFAAGVPLLANYESVPIFFLLLSLVLMQKRSAAIGWILPLAVLARSTMILEAGVLSLYDFAVHGKNRKRLFLLLSLSAGAFAALKWGLIAHFAAVQTISDDHMHLLYQFYRQDIANLLVVLEFFVATSVATYAFYKKSLKWSGVGLVAVAFAAFSFLLFDDREFIASFHWLLVLLSLTCLWFFWPQNRRDWIFLFTIFGVFFVGSDNGIQKSGFLSFLLVAPALSLGIRHLSGRNLRLSILVLLNVASVFYLYGSLFRDSWAAIFSAPVVLTDPNLGIVVVSKTNAEIWHEFQIANAELSAQGPVTMVVGSNAPLLTVLTSLYEVSPPLIWSDVKPKELVQKEIADLCQSGRRVILALAKVDFTSAQRGGYNPFDSRVANAARLHCLIAPVHETNYFMFWSLARPNR